MSIYNFLGFLSKLFYPNYVKIRRLKHLILSVLIVFTLAGASDAMDGKTLEIAPFHGAIRVGAITDPMIQETSGIYASQKNKPILWVVNDSGNAPVLYAILPDGRRLREFAIEGAIKNTDWEDLAGFQYEGKDFLVIADVGDNKARRKFCSLFIVKEPDPGATGPLKLQWQMRFNYEDGPRDCEAVAVDTANQRILLLSKRQKPPVLYELPLVIYPSDTLYTARPIAKISTIPQPTASDLKEKYGKYRSRPTSMDLSSDGRTLFILTYKNGYTYSRKINQTWEEAFQSLPKLIRLPHPNTGELVQREAICIDHETGRLIVTTEQTPSPIYTLDPMD